MNNLVWSVVESRKGVLLEHVRPCAASCCDVGGASVFDVCVVGVYGARMTVNLVGFRDGVSLCDRPYLLLKIWGPGGCTEHGQMLSAVHDTVRKVPRYGGT